MEKWNSTITEVLYLIYAFFNIVFNDQYLMAGCIKLSSPEYYFTIALSWSFWVGSDLVFRSHANLNQIVTHRLNLMKYYFLLTKTERANEIKLAKKIACNSSKKRRSLTLKVTRVDANFYGLKEIRVDI